MPRANTWLLGVTLGISAAGLTLLSLSHTPQGRTDAAPAPARDLATSPPPPTPTHTADLQHLLDTPAVKEEERRLAFHNTYRNFFSRTADLSPAQRNSEAQALAQQIDDYEQRGELALSEALLLQVALIRATSGDEQEQKARASVLVARYKALSAAREQRTIEQQDAQFSQYKLEEKRIVDEVMAMDSVPGGLPRDEYLRQQLQEARERAYQ
ncbi:hypothetical protein JQX08_13770 [Pseudomonas sp. UL073]|uniref:Lipase modulator n=1 Tax=Zestomonas insulae TaxID=2809017 RepID=A0ABS2IFA5_9GAMM|nr:hypothetical protein [Pseudomonas insulae]MBM7061776.1 hypothetical protein [Pseudomonas insulae]